MKPVIPCFLLFSLLTSCKMTQPEYYDAGYFHSVPPRSEIYGFDEHPHDYHHPNYDHQSAFKKVNTDSKSTKVQKQPQSS
ncbi:hypothetical protein Lgra_2891 [Legionella gratiana]|uniref:Lipoprotein n=1 Tax=Legionella gratiana TaxID=45066 RepID=A0A378J5I5_9GAMM|nr:hypothetical protein [Legionella gratiana]KTD06114.1 hypothetical protein Lgra_2891 [Legionella gratiana]STX42875.1 Uncharacterised protein [Legionella gratiana]